MSLNVKGCFAVLGAVWLTAARIVAKVSTIRNANFEPRIRPPGEHASLNDFSCLRPAALEIEKPGTFIGLPPC
jgi:hypothetical protein